MVSKTKLRIETPKTGPIWNHSISPTLKIDCNKGVVMVSRAKYEQFYNIKDILN